MVRLALHAVGLDIAERELREPCGPKGVSHLLEVAVLIGAWVVVVAPCRPRNVELGFPLSAIGVGKGVQGSELLR